MSKSYDTQLSIELTCPRIHEHKAICGKTCNLAYDSLELCLPKSNLQPGYPIEIEVLGTKKGGSVVFVRDEHQRRSKRPNLSTKIEFSREDSFPEPCFFLDLFLIRLRDYSVREFAKNLYNSSNLRSPIQFLIFHFLGVVYPVLLFPILASIWLLIQILGGSTSLNVEIIFDLIFALVYGATTVFFLASFSKRLSPSIPSTTIPIILPFEGFALFMMSLSLVVISIIIKTTHINESDYHFFLVFGFIVQLTSLIFHPVYFNVCSGISDLTSTSSLKRSNSS